MEETTHAQTVTGYAAALLALARAEGDADNVTDELYRIAQDFSASHELRETLGDPRVPTDRKLGVVSDLLGSRASATTITLVEMLVSMRRIGDFKEIVSEHSSIPPTEIRDEHDLLGDLGCDSLDIVEIAMEIEEQFGVTVPDELSDRARTVGDVVDGVLQLLADR